MGPVHYTDFSKLTFERALDRLAGGLPIELSEELRKLLEAGELHDAAKIIAAVQKHAAQESPDVD